MRNSDGVQFFEDDDFIELKQWQKEKRATLSLDFDPDPKDYGLKVEKAVIKGQVPIVLVWFMTCEFNLRIRI